MARRFARDGAQIDVETAARRRRMTADGDGARFIRRATATATTRTTRANDDAMADEDMEALERMMAAMEAKEREAVDDRVTRRFPKMRIAWEANAIEGGGGRRRRRGMRADRRRRWTHERVRRTRVSRAGADEVWVERGVRSQAGEEGVDGGAGRGGDG